MKMKYMSYQYMWIIPPINTLERYNRFSHTTYLDTGCILIVSLFLAAVPP